jgi:hypothetical protein
MINSQMESSFCNKYCIIICVNKPYRKLMGQLRMDNTKKRKRYIKNFKQKAIDVLPTDTDLNKVDVWFQDETRIGQQVLHCKYRLK